MHVILLPIFCRKYQHTSRGTWPTLLLFLQIATGKSSCDFVASAHLWGHIVKTNRIFEYKPPPPFSLKLVCKMGGRDILSGDYGTRYSISNGMTVVSVPDHCSLGTRPLQSRYQTTAVLVPDPPSATVTHPLTYYSCLTDFVQANVEAMSYSPLWISGLFQWNGILEWNTGMA